jgi:acetylornithine deacetylase/succinyl-diaminopimelate desuccinylase-like protein
MWAAAELAAREDDLRGQVQVHLVCDEEKGGKGGSKVLAAAMESGQLRKPDGILSGELSWLHVRTAERGLFQFKIRFEGRSAHTARARVDGINAIAVASRAVLALEQHIDRFHPAVGFPVLSINDIDGGSAPNQVPPSCTIRVDRRLVPGETAESVLAEIGARLEGLEEQTPDGQYLPVHYELITEDDDLPPLTEANMTLPEDPLVDALWNTAEGVLGYRPEPFTDWGGATDARWFRALGVPMVILGPTGRGAHAADEYVDVSSVGAIGEIYRRTLAGLLGL